MLTEQRSKSSKKQVRSGEEEEGRPCCGRGYFLPRPLQLVQYILYQHPLALASLEVCEAPLSQAQKNIFTLLERSPLGCYVRSYTLQAESKEEKVWGGGVVCGGGCGHVCACM